MTSPEKDRTQAPKHNPQSADIAAKTEALLKNLWVRNLSIVRERLDVLDRAAGEAQAGTLADPLRREAMHASHNLAGSLGMFGYQHGTDIARQLEHHLEPASEIVPRTLFVLTQRLRASLPLEPITEH